MATTQFSGDVLFSVLSSASANSAQMGQYALKAGIDRYQKGDYEGAARQFRAAAASDPSGTNAVDVQVYLASAYLKLGNNDGAEKAYLAAIQLDPTSSDLHSSLGNLYFSSDRTQEAEQQYQKAYRLDASADNAFSLGQAQLKLGQLTQAEASFSKAISLARGKSEGYYGLGQVYAKEGRFSDAEAQFTMAIAKDPKSPDPHVDLGYLYADNGQVDKAVEQVNILNDMGSTSLADTLDTYIYTASKPKMLYAVTANFPVATAGSTPLAAIDSYLSVANASRQYTMQFFFDKQMDASSVRDLTNWQIGRSQGLNVAAQYNFAQPIPQTEAQIYPMPDYVYYDEDNRMATVVFTVRQNSAATATLDPSHVQFTFKGTDVFGNPMDTAANDFTGLNGVA